MIRKMHIDYDDPILDHYSANQLKKVADYAARKYLIKHSDGKCFITRRYFHPEDMDVAHYIPRGKICLRYDLRNIHLTSRRSNQWDNSQYNEGKWGLLSKHEFEYRSRLMEVYGNHIIETLQDVVETSRGTVYTREFYIETIENFRHG